MQLRLAQAPLCCIPLVDRRPVLSCRLVKVAIAMLPSALTSIPRLPQSGTSVMAARLEVLAKRPEQLVHRTGKILHPPIEPLRVQTMMSRLKAMSKLIPNCSRSLS